MLEILTLEQREKWDSIVKLFPNYDVYYLSGYVKAFQIHGDGEPLLIHFYQNSYHAINVTMKRDISLCPSFQNLLDEGVFFDLSSPYGYGGWILNEESNDFPLNDLETEYNHWCSGDGIICEFVRFHPMLKNAEILDNCIYQTTNLGKTVAIALDNDELIWQRFSSKNRGHIRKAIKSGVTIQMSSSIDAYSEFMQIYNKTMERDGADDYYRFGLDFYRCIHDELGDNALVFTAYLDDIAIASSIMLFANGYLNYHLSGQLFDYRKFSATNLLLYEASKWGCNNGFKTLHLGGGLGAKEGPLFDFKKSFNSKGEDYNYFVGKKIISKEKYEFLCKLRGIDSSCSSYFPAYRQ